MSKDDIQAFPMFMDKEGWESGMTLRDYFAAKAMQGMISAIPYDRFDVQESITAKTAYSIADAMLKERKI